MTSKNKKDDSFPLEIEKPLAEDLEPDDEEYQLAGEKLEVVKKILFNLKTNIDRAIKLLEDGYRGDSTLVLDKLEEIKNGIFDETEVIREEQIIEGVFDGQKMIGSDGNEYQVPLNYASKSKLVEGDILKLTINPRGNFIYKQIGPIGRKRIKAKLRQDDSQQYFAVFGPKKWKLLTAAATYFKGEPGDEVIILVPAESKSQWAAVENIIKIKEQK